MIIKLRCRDSLENVQKVTGILATNYVHIRHTRQRFLGTIITIEMDDKDDQLFNDIISYTNRGTNTPYGVIVVSKRKDRLWKRLIRHFSKTSKNTSSTS